MIRFAAAAVLVFGASVPGLAQDRTAAPGGAAVYIISPEDRATVSNPVTVRFGLQGMGVAPAGVELDNTGHHHLLINVAPDDIDLDAPR